MGTELQIVNAMLSTVGEMQQVTLETSHPSVVTARNILQADNADIQGKGWWFNKEFNLKLMPDDTGEVLIPAEALDFALAQSILRRTPVNQRNRYVKRAGKVYDTHEHTFNIGCPVHADIVTLLAIEDLPAPAFNYLRHVASHSMYVADDGDQQKLMRLEDRVNIAWADLKSAELQAIAPNALHSPSADNLLYRIGQGGQPSNPVFPGGTWR